MGGGGCYLAITDYVLDGVSCGSRVAMPARNKQSAGCGAWQITVLGSGTLCVREQ